MFFRYNFFFSLRNIYVQTLPYRESKIDAFSRLDSNKLFIADKGAMDSNSSKTEYFIHLLSSNYHRIYAFIQSVVINEADADDIMQDTSMVMWKKFDDFASGTDFVAWGITIAKYRILDYRRKRKDYQLSEDTLELLAAESEKMVPEMEKRFQALKDCLGKLNRKDIDLLKLRYTHNYPAKMIALRIGTTINMVYQNMSRIKLLLVNCVRKQLRAEDF